MKVKKIFSFIRDVQSPDYEPSTPIILVFIVVMMSPFGLMLYLLRQPLTDPKEGHKITHEKGEGKQGELIYLGRGRWHRYQE